MSVDLFLAQQCAKTTQKDFFLKRKLMQSHNFLLEFLYKSRGTLLFFEVQNGS